MFKGMVWEVEMNIKVHCFVVDNVGVVLIKPMIKLISGSPYILFFTLLTGN